jgi:hypothetical protein
VAAFFIFTVMIWPGVLHAGDIDGVVTPGEYDSSVEFDGGNYLLYWSTGGDLVNFGIAARTEGWVAVGFDPEEAMQGADMWLGWIDAGGRTEVVDAYGVGPFGPHPPDLELGGTSDILAFAGTQSGGVTTIEFSRKRNTGDGFDKELFTDGTLRILWAYGSQDNAVEKHGKRGYGMITESKGEIFIPVTSVLLLTHISVMSLSFVLMVFGMTIPRYMKKNRWWLTSHKTVGIIGASLGGAGIGLSVYLVSHLSGIHLRVVHSYAGALTITLIILTPIIGWMIFKGRRERKASYRKWHRTAGRIALVLMLATIVLGLIQAGIL